jgi:hypothetical protein
VSEIEVDIPAMTVLGTSVFDAFMQRNHCGTWRFQIRPMSASRMPF